MALHPVIESLPCVRVCVCVYLIFRRRHYGKDLRHLGSRVGVCLGFHLAVKVSSCRSVQSNGPPIYPEQMHRQMKPWCGLSAAATAARANPFGDQFIGSIVTPVRDNAFANFSCRGWQIIRDEMHTTPEVMQLAQLIQKRSSSFGYFKSSVQVLLRNSVYQLQFRPTKPAKP